MRKSAIRYMIGGSLILNTAMAPAAFAQSDQSANQIINALKPSGTLSDTTRGIKPLPPSNNTMAPMSSPMTSPAAMSEPSAPVSTPAAPAEAPSTNLVIAFDTGSATLSSQAISQLDELGKALTSAQLASYNFKIVGHTDTVGDPATNQTLSEQRAAAVKSYLESKFNVPDTRLQATGVGETDLLVNTPPQTPEPRNREVQIINLGQ
jgi:outer membrane protein OmpA-like peptidoglycan-associated protein